MLNKKPAEARAGIYKVAETRDDGKSVLCNKTN